MTEASESPGDEEPKHERHLASHIFNIVVMVIGGIALAWMLHNMGWTALRDIVSNVGWWFGVILALDLASLCMDAAALHAFMRPEARMIKYPRVLGAQASGRAINVLTPGGALGEATKLTMLMTHAPRDRVLSSVVLLNLSQFYLSVAVMIIGTPIMFLLVDLPRDYKIMVAIGFAVLVPLMVMLGFMIQRGAVSTLIGLVRRTRIISDERAKSWKERLREVDRHISELQRHRSAGTWKGLLWVLGSKLVTYTSTMLLLHTAGVHVTPALVVGVLSVGVLIQWVSQIVPMGLGLQDGGNYALFDLLGASGAHGMAVTMVNRARSIIVAVLGLGAMAVMHTINRLALARMHRKLRELRERAAAADEREASPAQ
ncbi:MAG TPA: lysylphosphatidylglycerol synthase transmembrane domain-containing protein [Kofleriaceae bacterium]|nr:lysylphosphatidylglycerol synthase transmembrane domain-containing protein [Kofleriaceae bacterium]